LAIELDVLELDVLELDVLVTLVALGCPAANRVGGCPHRGRRSPGGEVRAGGWEARIGP